MVNTFILAVTLIYPAAHKQLWKTHLNSIHYLQWTDTVIITICLILTKGSPPCPGQHAAHIPMATNNVNKKRLNPDTVQHWKLEMFQTVNHSQILWDPQAKTFFFVFFVISIYKAIYQSAITFTIYL